MTLASIEDLTPEERRELGSVTALLRKPLMRFVRGVTSADEFEGEFLAVFSLTADTRSERVASAVDWIFFAVEDYVGHGMVVNPDEGDIDAEQLLARARKFVALVGWDVED